jgi:D-alanyl-D-alanine carboxypeptidase (penicillin-binding protein 5/6)
MTLRFFQWALLLGAVFAANALPAQTSLTPKPLEIAASAYLLIDASSGRVLAGSELDRQLEPASLTKMMTAYVAFAELQEGNIALTDQVLVSELAWKTGGSKMFIEVDKRVSVEDLLKGVIVQSGNDASVALAEYIAGDVSTFGGLMNQYAARLGMTKSNFVNATGLPADDHYTTATDLAQLAIAMIRDFPTYYKWHAQKKFTFNDIEQFNRNKLLWRDESVDGIKTGYTSSAGYCMVVSAEREGMRLVAVVLGSASAKSRARESHALLNYGFRFYETRRLYGAGEPITRTRVWKGESEQLELGLIGDLYVTVPRGQYKNLDATLEIDINIEAPVIQGETRGRVVLKLADELVAERVLVALRGVPEGGIWRQVTDYVKLLFH